MGIKVLSLFDGMSVGRIALREMNVDVETYYASEIDKHAIAQTQLNFPDTIQLGSVTEVDARKLGHIDLLIGGSPCFAAGTKILTSKGYKNIEDVKLGEMVLTHKNRWRKVVDIGCKYADTFEVKAQCALPIVCTADHKFWSRHKSFVWKNEMRTRRLALGEPEWVSAENLKGDYYVCINKHKSFDKGLQITDEEAWVLGRYLADGHTRKDIRYDGGHNGSRSWQLILSIGSKKLNDFKKHVPSLKYSCYPHSPSVYRCTFSSKKLVELAEKHCSCGAFNKFVSMDIFNSSASIKKAFLEGFLSGDGYIRDNKVSITTISFDLALSLSRLILDVEGVHVNVLKVDTPEYRFLDGRMVHQHTNYLLTYTRNLKADKVVYDEDKIWFGVKKYTHIGEQPVWNITVEEDHSYTANNVVVKNCQSFSFAGRRNGMSTETNEEIYTLDRYLELKNEGFKFVGESYLFWEYMRILHEVRETNPNVLFFLENVEMGEKWEAVLTKAIGIAGVHVNSALVSAQNRRRIYWTNIRTKTIGLFKKVVPDIPQPEDQHIYLEDILEDKVDEKYYLKQETVDKLLANGIKGMENLNVPAHKADEAEIGDDFGEDA